MDDRKTMRIGTLVFAGALALSGCADDRSVAITHLEADKVTVRSYGDAGNESEANAKALVLARKGCAMHDRVPEAVHTWCIYADCAAGDGWKRHRGHLFACVEP